MKYDKEYFRKMGEALDGFLYIEENFFRIEGLTLEEHEEAVKTVRELIKILKKGKTKRLDEVVRKDIYYDMKNRGIIE